MTNTRRTIANKVESLEGDADDRDGFRFIKIGGDPDEGGFYEYDAERGVYINENGHTRPDAPEGEPNINLVSGGGE